MHSCFAFIYHRYFGFQNYFESLYTTDGCLDATAREYELFHAPDFKGSSEMYVRINKNAWTIDDTWTVDPELWIALREVITECL